MKISNARAKRRSSVTNVRPRTNVIRASLEKQTLRKKRMPAAYCDYGGVSRVSGDGPVVGTYLHHTVRLRSCEGMQVAPISVGRCQRQGNGLRSAEDLETLSTIHCSRG